MKPLINGLLFILLFVCLILVMVVEFNSNINHQHLSVLILFAPILIYTGYLALRSREYVHLSQAIELGLFRSLGAAVMLYAVAAFLLGFEHWAFSLFSVFMGLFYVVMAENFVMSFSQIEHTAASSEQSAPFLKTVKDNPEAVQRWLPRALTGLFLLSIATFALAWATDQFGILVVAVLASPFIAGLHWADEGYDFCSNRQLATLSTSILLSICSMVVLLIMLGMFALSFILS